MAFHNCTLKTADGGIVATEVCVNVEESGGEDNWYGTISITHFVDLEAGKTYMLVLGDGRTGEFCVQRNTSAGGEDRAVSFRGLGPLTAQL
jgi:hypothetical protein